MRSSVKTGAFLFWATDDSTAKTNSATEFTEKTREKNSKNSKNSVVSVAKQPFCNGVTDN
jgi:hypothetical protein